jgi:hypothetical protein
MFLPLIMILALEKMLDANLVGVLIAALAGYLLGGVSNSDAEQRPVQEVSEPTTVVPRRELNIVGPDMR